MSVKRADKQARRAEGGRRTERWIFGRIFGRLKGWFMRRLCPKLYVNTISDIDIDGLWRSGIRALLLDLDNTITALHGRQVSPQVRRWLERAKRRGFKVCIVSNETKGSRVAGVARSLGVGFIAAAMKPRRKAFQKAMKGFHLDPEQIAMVGDQLFTDILGGNRLGLFTILVRPITSKSFITGKIMRLLERPLLKWIEESTQRQ